MQAMMKCGSQVVARAGRPTAAAFKAEAAAGPHRAFASGTRLPQAAAGARSSGRKVAATALFSSGSSTAQSAYDFTLTDIDGKKLDLAKFKGKVVLAVNVASACGFTPQYKDLAELDQKYRSKGLVILGAPCNQFGGQEPGSPAQIKQKAASLGAKFPLTGKLDVNGPNADPFFKFLKSKKGGILTSDIKWNFSKFLIAKDGSVASRHGSTTTPASLEGEIQRLLAA